MRKVQTLTSLILPILCLTFSLSAQSMAGLGAINGTVKDASGAVVPGAKVVVANPSTGIRRALETNESGLFAAPSLPPGKGSPASKRRNSRSWLARISR